MWLGRAWFPTRREENGDGEIQSVRYEDTRGNVLEVLND